jgi:hypothetical protein
MNQWNLRGNSPHLVLFLCFPLCELMMVTLGVNKEDKEKALRQACEAHVRRMNEAKSGKGVCIIRSS